MTPDEVAALAHDLLHGRDTSALERVRMLYTRLQPAEFDALILQIVTYWSQDKMYNNSETTLRKLTPLVSAAILPDLMEQYRTRPRSQFIRSRLMSLLGEHPHPRIKFFWLAQYWTALNPFYHQLNRLMDSLLANYPSVFEFVTYCLDHLAAPALMLDYDEQEFRIVWDETLRLIDTNGRQHTVLPAPASYEDIVQLDHAEQIWQHCQTLAREIALVVKAIWERAMVDDYRWSRSQFRRLFWENRLTQLLAQRVIWGVYQDNTLVDTFRISEDLSLNDAHDQPYTFPTEHIQIGVAHPFHLSDTERANWNTLLNDYEIIPAFPQMQRSRYTLPTTEEPEIFTVERAVYTTNRSRVRAIQIWRMGWTLSQRDTLVRAFGKQHNHISAHIILKKVTGYEYKVENACFTQGKNDAPVPIHRVSPLVLSETLYTMEQLRG